MAPLITTAALTAALLAGLWMLIYVGWWLLLRFIDPLLERSRASVQQERILKSHGAWQQQQQRRARELANQRRQVVDLDGQPQWLLPEELRAFHQLCWAELGLAADSPWTQVRQQWRRASLRWHPDHGGHPATWLRKQRAYEALKGAASQARWFTPSAASPRRIGGRAQIWPWRRG
jgi:hypothetical protein